MNLSEIGFSSFFTNKLESTNSDFSIARVTTVNKESFNLFDGEKEYFGRLTGNMMYASESPEDFPTVGDFVLFQKFDEDSVVIIHKVIERQNLLKRKSSGKKVDYQLIGANIDYAIIIQALDNDFNINRLERYLTMVQEFNVEPILLFSKADLISDEELNKIIENVTSRVHESKIISFSNLEEKSLEKIKQFLLPEKTYCLIGSSGVGKTTLINNLIKKNEFATKEVREADSKGKHTTTNRHLIFLNNGSMIVDTPGMRELANISAADGIDQTFDEITELGNNCMFSDCSHTLEKGCEILKALESGDLDSNRYENFLKLKKESDHYERSYLENRKKDKAFGKMVKEIMKHKKR